MSITLVHGLTLNRNGSEPERALPCTGVAIPAPPACPGRADEGQPVARRSAPHWPAARPSRLRRRLLGSLLALVGLAPGAAAAHSTFRTAPARAPAAPSPPADPRTILLQTSPVAGFQYHEGGTVWAQLAVGDTLCLVREPDNPFDPKAVRVEWEGHMLGYVPRLENHAVSQLLDRGEKLSAHILALEPSPNPWERVTFAVTLIHRAAGKSSWGMQREG